MTERRRVTRQLVEKLEQVLQALRTGVSQEWFSADLTMPQLRTLFALLGEGQCRMSALASRLGISLSGATGLMDRLVEKGLVERWVNPEERRSVVAGLTPAGRQLAERLLHLRRAQWEERLNSLTPDEIERARQGLSAVLDGLARGAAGAATDSPPAAEGQQTDGNLERTTDAKTY